MKTRLFSLPLLVAGMILNAVPLPGQTPPPAAPPDARTPTNFYDSQAHGNDFTGAGTLADLGFTDVHGGVTSLDGGNLLLTPDGTHGGTDAYLRDFVLRKGDREQVRDLGCRVVLPAGYRQGGATIGLLLRFQADGTGLLLNFAPDADPSLIAYSVAAGAAARRGEAPLSHPYAPSHPVALEARVIADAAAALTATDLTTGQILGFLNVPLDFGAVPAGGFGLVPWMIAPGSGSIAVASVQTYPVTAVVCDGDSLTTGENCTVGKGTASPLATSYPGVVQRLLGNRYHVFNLGRSGLTVTAMNNDAARRVDALLAPAERPPVVVIEGGTNDFGIDGSIKPPMPVAQAVQTVYGRLQTYWGARHAARPDVTVFDVTNLPAAHPAYVRNLGSASGFNERRDALNALRKSPPSGMDGARPDRLVDLTAIPHLGHDGDEKDAAYFQADDGTHLTDAGYALKGAAVAGAIVALPNRVTPSNTR